MAFEEYYCNCGKKIESGGICGSCSDRWEREEDRIRDYVELHNLGYDDQKELERKSWDRMNLGSRTVRYCDYRGSCGNIIESSWGDYCPSCVEKQKQYEIEEERRRRRAVDDY